MAINKEQQRVIDELDRKFYYWPLRELEKRILLLIGWPTLLKVAVRRRLKFCV